MQRNNVWMQRATRAIGVMLLASIPAIGLAVMAPALFSVLGETDQASSGAVAVSNALLRFDAPAVNLERVKPAAGTTARQDDVVVLNDWHFTAAGDPGDADDAVANSPQDPFAPMVLALRNLTALQAAGGPTIPAQDGFLNSILQFQNLVNTFLSLQEQQLTGLFGGTLPPALVGLLEVQELAFRSFFLTFLPSSLITSPDAGPPVSPHT